MGLKSLRKALKAVPVDDFEVGDVIRWEMTYDEPVDRTTITSGPFGIERGIFVKSVTKKYTYVAVKTPAGWYTTSRTSAVPGRMNFQDLVEVLSDPRVSDVCLASSWDPVV